VFVYLHGFNSSPQSFKVRVLRERLTALGRGAELIAPELSHWPEQAIASVERALSTCDPGTTTLIGSSLGGYYATWLAERHGLRAVLVNPAVRPYELLGDLLGTQTNLYTGATYELTATHVEQLRALEVEEITHPERYLLLIAMADEVLDARVALHKYRAAQQIIDPAGNHGFSDFARHLDAILDFGAGTLGVPRGW
jgi:predicted esterase YcpF (UPF0227 family)